jgi:uncharacterized membrane-anchored protein
MRKAAIPMFILMALAQLLLPGWKVMQHERVLRQGVPMLFRTSPIDPYDPFRGEYVILHFALEDTIFMDDRADPFQSNENVSVLLKDVNGEAAVAGFSRQPPTDGTPHVRARIVRWDWEEAGNFRIDLPFDRYYLEQGTGRRTEELVYGSTWEEREAQTAHARVRILNGRAVVEDLLVNGRSVREIILGERLP